MPTLLAIDDEPAILELFRLAFEEPVTLVTASTGAEGLEQVVRCHPDVVLLDMDLPDMTGLETFRQIHEHDPNIPVIFATGHGTTSTSIEAIMLGAYEYLLKPLNLEVLRELVQRAFEASKCLRVQAGISASEPSEESKDILVGRCAAMQEVYKAIGRVAPQDVPVLVLGESGTGKELVARAIYHYSRRSAGPFLTINCAAIPEALLESELFGHEKGAFTGADRKRIGRFEQCSGGTLFLDEIGDMSPLTQTKILRVLQEQHFERVGGNEVIMTNVRVIAATNRDLEKLAGAGQFRGDLYYRLSVFTIHLPPLRERIDDLPLLAEHFLKRFRRELGKDVQSIRPEAMAALQRYPWPGNLRELQNVLKQALLLTTGPVLLEEFLPDVIRRTDKATTVRAVSSQESFVRQRLDEGSSELYAEWLAQMEPSLCTLVLRHTGGNLSQAARILGLDRSTLRSKLKTLGVHLEDIAAGEE